MRYLAIRCDRICAISDHPILNEQCIVVPSELAHLSSRELITYAHIKNGQVKYKYLNKPAHQLKVAIVSNFKMQCGIASYCENLTYELIKLIGDYKLFVEDNNQPLGRLNQICDMTVSEDKVVSCWKRGESIKQLVVAIQEYDPDCVLIQHEFGLWPNACHWLSLMNQLSEYRVVITMHSVFHHQDKTICEAAMPEIVVHLQGAKDVLKNEKKVSGNVYVIHHGCSQAIKQEPLWNYYKSEHTFMSSGYGLRYKHFEKAIEATALLKTKYSDVFFTLLFSESPPSITTHQLYYQDLMELVEKLDLVENVAIIRGYQSNETLDSYFRTNKVAVFPYDYSKGHICFGVSGMAPLAMSKSLPVITSSVNHFSDLPTIKADTPQEIANELSKLFEDAKLRESQINKQIDYLNANTWEKVAQKYVKILENRL